MTDKYGSFKVHDDTHISEDKSEPITESEDIHKADFFSPKDQEKTVTFDRKIKNQEDQLKAALIPKL